LVERDDAEALELPNSRKREKLEVSERFFQHHGAAYRLENSRKTIS
jgi:hypothetical protein